MLSYRSGQRYRKLEAYATWGMLPACLPSHRQRVVPKQLTNIFHQSKVEVRLSPLADDDAKLTIPSVESAPSFTLRSLTVSTVA